jgi:hypothetical protein
VLQLWGRPHGELPGLREMERGEAALAKRAPERGSKSTITAKYSWADSSEEQIKPHAVWSHVIRGWRVVNAAPAPPTPNPITSQLMKARKPLVTPTSKTAKPEKPAPKPLVAPTAASVKPTVTKPVAAQPSITKLLVTPRPTSPLEGIADLHDQLPTKACEELHCRLLTPSPPSPRGEPTRGLS